MKPIELELVVGARVDLGLFEYGLSTLQESPGLVPVTPGECDHGLGEVVISAPYGSFVEPRFSHSVLRFLQSFLEACSQLVWSGEAANKVFLIQLFIPSQFGPEWAELNNAKSASEY